MGLGRTKMVADLGEFGLIDRLLEPSNDAVLVGMGDDAAVVGFEGGTNLVLTKELLVEGRHFDLEHFSPKQVGIKAIESTFSDLVAMGAFRALYVLVGLAIPGSTPVQWVDSLYKSLRTTAGRSGAEIVGGDTVQSKSIHLSITAVGEATSSKNNNPFLERSGALPGDLVKVTGPLGGAAAGYLLLEAGLGGFERLKQQQREPKARWDLVGELKPHATAAIDLSDGLAGDLEHICVQSRKGAKIVLESIPIEEGVAEASRLLGRDAYDLALHGGEDYELLFTVPPSNAFKTPGVVVGEVTNDPTERLLVGPGNQTSTFRSVGFDHFRFGGEG